mgnify:CR=1 FL=1
MAETTTIQVRKEQAERLKEIRGPSGNYKTAIDTLLEAYDTDDAGGVDTNALVADLKADLAPAVADEVEARLR